MTLETIKKFQLVFPAVTICNLNRVSCSQLKKTIEEWDINEDKVSFDALLGIKTLSDCPDIIEPTAATSTTSEIQTSTEMDGDIQNEFSFLSYYMTLNESTRLMIGHQFDDFVKKCTFSGSNCLNIRYPKIFVFKSHTIS